MDAMPYSITDNGDKSIMKTDKVPACTNALYSSEYVSYSNLSEKKLNGANESYITQCRDKILKQDHIIDCFWLKCQSLTDGYMESHMMLHMAPQQEAPASCGYRDHHHSRKTIVFKLNLDYSTTQISIWQELKEKH